MAKVCRGVSDADVGITVDGEARFGGGGDAHRKIGWECVAHFQNPSPYFSPKSVIFPTLCTT